MKTEHGQQFQNNIQEELDQIADLFCWSKIESEALRISSQRAISLAEEGEKRLSSLSSLLKKSKAFLAISDPTKLEPKDSSVVKGRLVPRIDGPYMLQIWPVFMAFYGVAKIYL